LLSVLFKPLAGVPDPQRNLGVVLEIALAPVSQQRFVELAEQSGLRTRIDAMFSGEKINVTENRAVLVSRSVLRKARPSSSMAGTSHRKFTLCSISWPTLPSASAAANGKATAVASWRPCSSIVSKGVDKLTSERREHQPQCRDLCSRNCRLTPRLMSGGSKLSVRRTADQMPLNIECVVDRRMNRNKALSRFSQFEALHLSLSPPDRLM
jgi:hypothetical protein